MAHRRQIEETLDALSDLEGTDLPSVPPVLVLRSPLTGGAGGRSGYEFTFTGGKARSDNHSSSFVTEPRSILDISLSLGTKHSRRLKVLGVNPIDKGQNLDEFQEQTSSGV